MDTFETFAVVAMHGLIVARGNAPLPVDIAEVTALIAVDFATELSKRLDKKRWGEIEMPEEDKDGD